MSVASKYVVLLWALVFAPLANSAYATISDPAAIQVQRLHTSLLDSMRAGSRLVQEAVPRSTSHLATLCLQTTGTLSATVVHLGIWLSAVCLHRSESYAVVVNDSGPRPRPIVFPCVVPKLVWAVAIVCISPVGGLAYLLSAARLPRPT